MGEAVKYGSKSYPSTSDLKRGDFIAMGSQTEILCLR